MTARIELALHVDGDGETERSLREHIEWLNRLGPHSPEYHEVMAHLAVMAARLHWRDADRIRSLNRHREARAARARARARPP